MHGRTGRIAEAQHVVCGLGIAALREDEVILADD